MKKGWDSYLGQGDAPLALVLAAAALVGNLGRLFFWKEGPDNTLACRAEQLRL